MPRVSPALDLTWPLRPHDAHIEQLLAEIDEESPTAVADRPNGIRIYFTTAPARARAAVKLIAIDPLAECVPADVSDEDWAARSQAGLEPVRVGNLVIAPPGKNDPGRRFRSHAAKTTPGVVFVFIQPSMGFGTGHHASTRLCLRLLQQIPLKSRRVLDVGTGSGVLALAAAKLGASTVVAIDNDEDALASARTNVALNGAESVVTLSLGDVADVGAGFSRPDNVFDVVLANLTGASLVRHSRQLAGLLGSGGTLVSSGFTQNEETEVTEAFAGATLTVTTRAEEEDWVALAFVAA